MRAEKQLRCIARRVLLHLDQHIGCCRSRAKLVQLISELVTLYVKTSKNLYLERKPNAVNSNSRPAPAGDISSPHGKDSFVGSSVGKKWAQQIALISFTGDVEIQS